jgi:hypothetical protein
MVRNVFIIFLMFLAFYSQAFEYVPPTGDKLPVQTGNSGKVLKTDGANYSWETNSADNVSFSSSTLDPTGFINRTGCTLNYINASREVNLTPVSGSFTYYRNGDLKTKSATQRCWFPDTTGLYFVKFGSVTETLEVSTVAWSFSDVQVAMVYYNATKKTGQLMDERHTHQMDFKTHEYLHDTVGTRYESGLTVSGYTLNSDSDTDVQIGITGGVIHDEDLDHTITDSSAVGDYKQDLTKPAKIPVWWRSGSSGEWVKNAATSFYFDYTAGSRANYNQFTAGAWKTTEVATTNYVAYWIVATNQVDDPIISIMGQRVDTTLNNAIANNLWESMTLGTLPSPETKLLYRVIIQTSTGYSGTTKSRVVNVTDLRSISNLPAGSYVASDHSALTGLTALGSHPASAIAPDTTSFNNQLSTADDTVQKALDTFDNNVYLNGIYDTDDYTPYTGAKVTFKGGTGATVTRTGGTIEISATGTGTFNKVYANTDGTYSDGPALTFKNGSNVTITRSGDTIEIASTASAGGYSAEWTDLGSNPTRSDDDTISVTDNAANVAIFKVGRPLKFVISSTTYYAMVIGVVDAGSTLTVNLVGAAYTATSSAFYYSDLNRVRQVNFAVEGYYADATNTTLLQTDNRMYYIWELGAAAVVSVKVRCTTEDSGASEPYVTVTNATNSILTKNTNKGLQPTSASWAYSISDDISTTNYSVANGSAIEIAVDANGTNDDGRDLSVCMVAIIK